jgi:hypothetical protein
MHMTLRSWSFLAASAFAVSLPDAAFAYGGPGLGLGAIATAMGVVAAIILGLVSILWYPFKRLIRRLRGARATPHRSGDPDR